jgi:hypothetical protein
MHAYSVLAVSHVQACSKRHNLNISLYAQRGVNALHRATKFCRKISAQNTRVMRFVCMKNRKEGGNR